MILNIFNFQLLIQQQTMAQREQKMAVGNDLGGLHSSAALRNPDMIPRNEQALLNEQMMHIETPARGELKQTEEKVLSSGTVPAKYPGSNPASGYKEKTSMLKTTSPRLQVRNKSIEIFSTFYHHNLIQLKLNLIRNNLTSGDLFSTMIQISADNTNKQRKNNSSSAPLHAGKQQRLHHG